MILVSMVGMVSVFDGSRTLTSTAEETETATHQAEREMERILSLPYDKIALKSVPATSPDTNNPSFFVTQGPPARYRWDQGATGPQSDDLVVDAANGDLDPSAIAWSDTQSRQQGSIHRFVTWTGDLCAADRDPAGQADHRRGHRDRRQAEKATADLIDQGRPRVGRYELRTETCASSWRPRMASCCRWRSRWCWS